MRGPKHLCASQKESAVAAVSSEGCCNSRLMQLPKWFLIKTINNFNTDRAAKHAACANSRPVGRFADSWLSENSVVAAHE